MDDAVQRCAPEILAERVLVIQGPDDGQVGAEGLDVRWILDGPREQPIPFPSGEAGRYWRPVCVALMHETSLCLSYSLASIERSTIHGVTRKGASLPSPLPSADKAWPYSLRVHASETALNMRRTRQI